MKQDELNGWIKRVEEKIANAQKRARPGRQRGRGNAKVAPIEAAKASEAVAPSQSDGPTISPRP